ncbi:MAG: proline--tRNA ligase [Verrucomicrobiota bacterium]|nr:proline--tRNA ligase [Verrucomicrobiota bacterium]
MSKRKRAIQPTREENYPEWYQSVLQAAELADHSPVRGCMVIRPWGFAIWEKMQRYLDQKFKETGHSNAYFPLFVPLHYFEKEAAHVEGFAKECAVVTHHRLEKGPEGKLVPGGPLEEPLIVRPTSEMIIGHVFAKWIDSYRDLPLLINQWCNVVRWEMRTRMFLRTTEFLWQEGHTVHATKEEAEEEAQKMLFVYRDFVQGILAIPFIAGEKSASERFPGAVNTYAIEGMMQDRKAIQGATSHFLGQNFSRACEISFQNVHGEREFGWGTSWGATTRLVGGLIMAHSDDDGLVLPPRIAPLHLVILPIAHDASKKEEVVSFAKKVCEQLSSLSFAGEKLQVSCDVRDLRGGEKNWSWIKKGIPLRLEIGMREIASGRFALHRRDRMDEPPLAYTLEELEAKIPVLLEEIQEALYQRALLFRRQNTKEIDSLEEFSQFFSGEGGFALCHWNEDPAIEAKVKEELGVTIRCIPFDKEMRGAPGRCLFTGEPSPGRVLFAKAY